MKKIHSVTDISFDHGYMLLNIDEVGYRVEVRKISARLARSSMDQRRYCEVTSSGYGIHWPLIDEDLSIDAIIPFAVPQAPVMTHA